MVTETETDATHRDERAPGLDTTALEHLLLGERGEVKPMVLLWALGVPLPIVLIIALVRGC